MDAERDYYEGGIEEVYSERLERPLLLRRKAEWLLLLHYTYEVISGNSDRQLDRQ